MGTDRIIYIRTDGNREIASGHLVRCYSIAHACHTAGMDVRFLVSDEESCSLLEAFLNHDTSVRFPIIRLKTASYDHLEKELPEVVSLISNTCVTNERINADIVYLIDSYFVTENYLTALRPLVKVAYLDDLQLFDYPVDLLINYDVIPDSAVPSFKTAYQKAGQLLLGSLYAPLRRQFQNRSISVKERVSDLLITTGGSDPYHFCLKLIRRMHDHAVVSDKTLHLVIGKLNTDKEALYALAKTEPFLRLYENVSDMASLMERCDLAVSASGTTLYELCALGVPAISFVMADNQLACAEAFDQAGAIPCAGDLRTEEEKVFQAVMDFMMQTSLRTSSFKIRKSAHETMRRLVDGNGAMRIADALKKL